MQNGLKDSKGRTWTMAVTIAGVKGFEQRTGMKVFATMFELWKKYKGTEDTLEVMLAIIADLFPGIEEAAAFVYECASVEGEKTKPSFDDFCATVSPLDCGVAVTQLTERLQAFMPDSPKDLKSDGAAPLGH